MNSYTLGSLVRLTATFEVSDVATNPTAITFKLRKPDGTVVTYVYGTDAELVRGSTGVFYVDWTMAAEGVHAWRMAGTGAAIGAAEKTFTVLESAF